MLTILTNTHPHTRANTQTHKRMHVHKHTCARTHVRMHLYGAGICQRFDTFKCITRLSKAWLLCSIFGTLAVRAYHIAPQFLFSVCYSLVHFLKFSMKTEIEYEISFRN